MTSLSLVACDPAGERAYRRRGISRSRVFGNFGDLITSQTLPVSLPFRFSHGVSDGRTGISNSEARFAGETVLKCRWLRMGFLFGMRCVLRMFKAYGGEICQCVSCLNQNKKKISITNKNMFQLLMGLRVISIKSDFFLKILITSQSTKLFFLTNFF